MILEENGFCGKFRSSRDSYHALFGGSRRSCKDYLEAEFAYLAWDPPWYLRLIFIMFLLAIESES